MTAQYVAVALTPDVDEMGLSVGLAVSEVKYPEVLARLGRIPRTLRQCVPNRLDAAQRGRVRRINLQRNVLTDERLPFDRGKTRTM